jgi:hypothetical protein
MEAQKKVRKGKALIEHHENELSTTELQNLAMCAILVYSTTPAYQNEDFAEAAKVAKPLSTGPGGSGYVREYRRKIADLRRKQAALKRTVLQETWIYKLG